MSYNPQVLSALVLSGRVKTGDTARTNTATVADDPDLIIPLKANTRYNINVDLIFTSSVLAGFKTALGLPAGSTIQYVNVGQNDMVLKNLTDLLGIPVTTTNPNYAYIRGIIRTGSTPGNLSVKWAQNVASGLSSAVLKSDSALVALELV